MGPSGQAGAALPRKPWIELAGRPLLEHTLAAFDAARRVVEVVLVVHPDDRAEAERRSAELAVFEKVRVIVEGGAERADSVAGGARWCSFAVDVICVHDAARPLIRPERIDEVIEVAAREGAAVLAVPVSDTIKAALEADGRTPRAERTLDRSRLWAAQTPQAFAARRFRAVLERAREDGFRPTDDAALWERYVGPVPIVAGDRSNLKVTTPEDVKVATALLESGEEARGTAGSRRGSAPAERVAGAPAAREASEVREDPT